MTLQTETAATDANLAPRGIPFRTKAEAILLHLVDWARTCRRSYRATATYEELWRLSDAELARRGLDRATLNRALREGF